jgi:ankyrin repeat protein
MEAMDSENKKYRLHNSLCENSDKDISIMSYILSIDSESLERVCHDKMFSHEESLTTALVHAASAGHEKCLDFLLNQGAQWEKNTDGANLLQVAIKEGNGLKIVDYLFKYGYFNPIFESVKYGEEYNMNCGSNYYLMCAVRNFSEQNEEIEMLNLMLHYGIKVDYIHTDIKLESYPRHCPSIVAIYFVIPECLKFLLLHGAVIDHRHTGRNDLSDEVIDCISLIHHFAILSFSQLEESLDMLNMLYELGANLWEKNRNGLNPLEVRQDALALEREIDARGGNDVFISYNQEYDEDETELITKQMEKLMSKPLSLKSWCRISLLRTHGLEYLNYVEIVKNDLPETVVMFLKGDDLPTNTQPDFDKTE